MSTPKPSNPISQLPENDRAAAIAAILRDYPNLLQHPEVEELVVSVVQRVHQGPLPPAEDFAAYEAALPGTCDRIMSMAEVQQQQQFTLNQARLVGDFKEARRGQLFALIVALSGLGLCAGTVWMQASWQATVALGAFGMSLLIAPFIIRRGS